MINMKEYGAAAEMAAMTKETILGRVTAVHKGRYELVCEKGGCFGQLKKSVYLEGTENFPTVGDFVELQYNETGDSRIVKTLPRTSFFSRLDPSSAGHWDQAVAANFDYVFLLQSLNADFNLRRLERYLALAWQSGAEPVVVLTKADLKADFQEELNAVQKAAAGVSVHAVSAKSGYGMEALQSYLQPGKTIVFLGSSGVGKSSLVNALAGQEWMETGEIREEDCRGRHTTTYRQLIMTKEKAIFIDTPGMRELGMWNAKEGLEQTFYDVEKFLGQCRFRDCRHETEPGCAVREALAAGTLSRQRWESYCKLKREVQGIQKRAAATMKRRSASPGNRKKR